MRSLGSAMRTNCRIFARTAETDTWVLQASGIMAAIEQLDARGKRATEVMLDPDITHVGRFPTVWLDDLIAGRRLVRVSDGVEWVIGPVRDNTELLLQPHVRAYLKAADAVTA